MLLSTEDREPQPETQDNGVMKTSGAECKNLSFTVMCNANLNQVNWRRFDVCWQGTFWPLRSPFSSPSHCWSSPCTHIDRRTSTQSMSMPILFITTSFKTALWLHMLLSLSLYRFKKDSKQNVIYKPAAKDIDQTSVTVTWATSILKLLCLVWLLRNESWKWDFGMNFPNKIWFANE